MSTIIYLTINRQDIYHTNQVLVTYCKYIIKSMNNLFQKYT